jgi:outer membrane protein assembly factor BamB
VSSHRNPKSERLQRNVSGEGFAMSFQHLCRLALLGLTGLVLAVVCPLLVADPKPAADWPIFRGNAFQTGVAVSSLPEPLELRWQFKAAEKTNDSFEGAAAIVGGTVYIGSLDECLYALDLATGKVRWKYKEKDKVGPFKASPSVRDGLVYVGDCDGIFHCLDAATGQRRWTFEAGAEVSSSANFASDHILFGSYDETLYCLSKEGKPQWKFKVPGGPVMGSPAIVGNRTFAAGCDSTLHVINLADGKELSSVELGGQVGASVAVGGDQLFISTMSDQVMAVDWKKGQIDWKFEPAKRREPFFASPALTDNLVIVGSRNKRVYALDRKTGTEVWNFATRDRVDSSPVIVGKRVFVGSSDGNLYVLDLEKGTELQRIALGSAITASPAVGEHSLVIGTTEGVVYCFGAKK